MLLGGTDGLSFFNDVTVYSPPPSASSSSPTCLACNGPKHWHRLGGGSKGEEQAEAAKAKQSERVKQDKGSVWPGHRFAAAACAVRCSGGEDGIFLFGGMDEETDLNDASLLHLRARSKTPRVPLHR